MKPERASRRLDGIAHARARMFEFNVPEGLANLDTAGSDPAELLSLVVGILGDEAARIADLEMEGEGSLGRIIPNEPFALRFAAAFLHAYVSSRYGESLATELLLLSAAGYYLCDLAGSAGVLVREAALSGPPLDHWDALLRWLLTADRVLPPELTESIYSEAQNAVADALQTYFTDGARREDVIASATALRHTAYSRGTPRDLLYADLVAAVARKRLRNAARHVLPPYSGLEPDLWTDVLAKPSFLRELWPSQHVFGERGILQGRSAVIQMPTSAGKTRGIELIIRSAFFSERAKLAVVVAPFRALCTEITGALRAAFKSENVQLNELSDALLVDYSALLKTLFEDEEDRFDFGIQDQKQIVVLTPEKLLYVLRHSPELIDAVGVVIYDEGHQFDSGERGVTYELLLTSIKRLLPKEKQIVLISAVITNADAIGRWLIGDDVVIVDGQNLSTTRRSVAFASWRTPLGQLQFVEPHDPDHVEYFVPRLIEQRQLALRPRERNPRAFPDRNANSVALYLGLQVVRNGSVAIFCGRKSTAGTIAAAAADAFDRGLQLPRPSQFCDPTELNNLGSLYAAHFGEEQSFTQAARLGIFSHHGNTPQGIRLSVEQAMKTGLVKFVICTSTLAQGVNLPIRYLIISGTMQGVDRIKARDFHNLIGRAGRAGMHTEGTIIFSDPELYDTRLSSGEQWRWREATKLLNPNAAEQTASSLLLLLAPFTNDRGDTPLEMNINEALREISERPETIAKRLEATAKALKNLRFTEAGLSGQLRTKAGLLEALESYLMANRGGDPFEQFLASVEKLAQETLAFALANDLQKTQLVAAFQDLARHIEARQPDINIQAVYGKTLLGLTAVQRVREWVLTNQEALIQEGQPEEELLTTLWPLIVELLGADGLGKFLPASQVLPTVLRWISGDNFEQLLVTWEANGGRTKWGQKSRTTTMDDIVSLCENAIAYEGTLIIAAVSELLASILGANDSASHNSLAILIKRLKYGLSDPDEITLFELGFADRIAANRIRLALPTDGNVPIRARLRDNPAVDQVLATLPQYFHHCFESIM
ncbi:DEAD/DEAH box helicase [Tunturiibacter gelidoferens]|uniref:Superfamily II DNA/RNA helicase n=1 Tax=Tunturiibacter gelidiferens TaxID=3069689 RepID=A0ACC5P558_9BACT|nr:DEAD/DEAH box helicase [Edaphobacter lichenicola]MBB5341986.1 superfamily II DNA/RNA helicase [Edaphobacter lichenicola]